MNQAISTFAAWLPAEGAKEMLSDGPTTTAGALFPPAAAVRADGGWRITGQFPFGSGCHNAKWLAMPAVEMDGDQPKVDPETGQPAPFAVVFPHAEATILDTWHTLGMRGTGSHDIAVDDLFIPDRFAAPVQRLENPAPGFEGPMYRMFPWTAILAEATVSVGIATAAIDEAIELCKTKTAAYNVTSLLDQQLPHFMMGKAKARVDASRDTLHRALVDAYDQVEKDNALLSVDSRIRLQLAASFAAEACAEAVRLVNDTVGSSSIRLGQTFERHSRDTLTLVQHASKSSPRYASAGRVMFGLETDWVWLTF